MWEAVRIPTLPIPTVLSTYSRIAGLTPAVATQVVLMSVLGQHDNFASDPHGDIFRARNPLPRLPPSVPLLWERERGKVTI